jgi:hypothetical protein
MMMWAIWLVGSAFLFLIGTHLFRAGKVRIVRLYVVTCLALVVVSLASLGFSIGSEAASWAHTVLSMLAPSTLVLVAWAMERDRKVVMGSHRGRDTATSSAYLHGAGGGTEGGF